MKKTIRTIWTVLNHKAFFVFFIVCLACLYGTKSDRWYGWTNPKVKKGEPIFADGAGYYAWMPQWFVYKTDRFQFIADIEKKYPQSRFSDNIYGDHKLKPEGNKYFTGSAIAMTPFFLTAHVYALNTWHAADGYSKPYLFMVSVAMIFYLLLGCIGIYYFLRRFGIDRIWIIGVLCAIALGTNIGFYTYVYLPYSHLFSFAVVAWLLYAAKRWSEQHSAVSFLFLCALSGLAFIIRPTNLIVLLSVPFFFSSTRLFLGRLRSLFTDHWKHAAMGMLSFALFVFIQLWNVHTESGNWTLNTYSGESFEFLFNPMIKEVLFDWGKGLFIFCPVLLLLFPGWIVLFRENRRLFWGTLLLFAVFTWITASWWCWWYGGGLGMRPYIDIFPVLALPIAFLLQYSRVWLKLFLIPVLVIGCWMGQVYEFQMKHNILHYDKMTYEQYWNVFMDKGLRYAWGMHLQYEQLPEQQSVHSVNVPFKSKGKAIPDNTFLKLLGDDWGDNPVAMIISQPQDSLLRFGAKIKGEVFLYSEDTNPSFHIVYFDEGQPVRDNRYFVGQFIRKPETLQEVEIELYPDLQYKSFDSVKVEFEEGNTFTGMKNLQLKQLSYR